MHGNDESQPSPCVVFRVAECDDPSDHTIADTSGHFVPANGRRARQFVLEVALGLDESRLMKRAR